MTEEPIYESALSKVRLLEFPKICDPRGNLSFAEGGCHVPFPIRRVFYIYDVPGGETRGSHAHKQCSEVLIAVAGSFEVRLSDGKEERIIRLNRANRGVLIPPGLWRTMSDFTTGTVALAFASELYDEADYIRDYDEFLTYTALKHRK